MASRSCAVGGVQFVASNPDVIPAEVSIFHPQLRDLLQPAWEKGKVLFIHRMAVECADFNSPTKAPTHFCSLDFAAVCLSTGAGLMAAGGEHSELDIRPLFPQPGSAASSGATLALISANASHDASSGAGGPSTGYRHVPRWHLRTPTGGSINNSICIQSEAKKTLSGLRTIAAVNGKPEPSIATAIASATLEAGSCETRHRGKRRKEDKGEEELPRSERESAAWRRDEPWGRPGEPNQPERQRGASSVVEASKASVSTSTSSKAMDKSKSLRILISNNDKSVKAFRLRPPVRERGNNLPSSLSGDQNERIEHGLPGLSRTQTVQFPTCINHSSFSPDGKHVISVGDTPEVFLYSVHPTTGELQKIASYVAASDAAFSTSWSPDSLHFAVASQDGNVSIWDVRSSEKIANLQTLQISDMYGAGAARVVKWSPCGRMLAFSEQQNYVHLVDTTTFEIVQHLRIPADVPQFGTSGLLDTAAEDPSGGVRSNEVGTEIMGLGGSSAEDLLSRALRDAEASTVAGLDESDVLDPTSDIVPAEEVNEWLPSPSSSASSLQQLSNTTRSTSLSRTSAASISRRWPSGHRYRDIGGSGVGGSGSRLASRVSALDRALLGDWSGEQLAQVERSGSALGARPTASEISPTGYRLRTYAEAAGPRIGDVADSPLLDSATPRTLDPSTTITTTATTNAGRGTTALQPQRYSGLWSFGHVMNRLRRGGRDGDGAEISGLTWDPDGDFLYVSTAHAIVRYTVIDTRSSLAQASLL